MTSKLTRAAYEQLITEDITWLLNQPDTLERSHIFDVLMYSVGQLYDTDEVVTDTYKGLPQSRINDVSLFDKVQMACPKTACITQHGESKCACKLKIEEVEKK